MDIHLREYQEEDLLFLAANERALLLHDPGTGKTPPVCVYMYWLWHVHQTGTCWVMPKSLLRKNRDELLRFTPLTEDQVVIIDGTPKQRQEQMARAAVVFLMGFKRFSDDWRQLKTAHPHLGCVVVDEFHMGYGGHYSKRTQSLYQAMRYFPRFVGMTGSLINGRLDSAYPAVAIIEPRYYFSYEAFLAEHAIRDPFDDTITGWRNHEKLGLILQHHSRRVTVEQVYGEEEKFFVRDRCQLNAKQEKAYRELEMFAIAELEDGKVIEGLLPGVNTIRCRQIMQCPEVLGVQAPTELTGKDERLLIHLADHKNTGEPLIIYAVFNQEVDRLVKLCEKQGFRVGRIDGTVPAKKRAEYDEQFRARQLDIIVATEETSGVGWNWGHVNHIIYASCDYKDTNFEQSYRRAIRGVRTIPLRITLLEYDDSIDQRIFQIITTKSDHAHKVDQTKNRIPLTKATRIETKPSFAAL